jgi:hypothetical protein
MTGTKLFLDRNSLLEYKVTEPYDNLCNKVNVYGRDNKCYPIDKDSLTESASPWSTPFFSWRTVYDSTQRKVGTKSIRCTSSYPYMGYANLALYRDFPDTLDLTKKESFSVLRWASRTMLPFPPNSFSVNADESLIYEVYLEDTGGRFVKYSHFNRPFMERNYAQNPQFTEFDVPVGPSHEIDGEWMKDDKAFPNVHGFSEVNAYDPLSPVESGLTKIGTYPYLDTEDNDDSYISGTDEAQSGSFTFTTLAGSASKIWDAFIFLKFRGLGVLYDGTYGSIHVDVKVGEVDHEAGTIKVRNNSYQGMMIGIPNLITNQSDFNSIKLSFRLSGYEDQEIRITYAKVFLCASDGGVSGDFEWNNVKNILFRWSYWAEDQAANLPNLYIDWLHFDNGRWFGTDEDSGSQDVYKLYFKEIFDDTIYSDTAALRRAKQTILKFKVPISTIYDVTVDYDYQSYLKAGYTIIVAAYDPAGGEITDPDYKGADGIPELEGVPVELRTYRMETITHRLTEDLDYEVNLVLSLDPKTWEGTIHGISERIRRQEQKYSRKPVEESTEVD